MVVVVVVKTDPPPPFKKNIKVRDGKWQCHMAASCAYHLPTMYQLLAGQHEPQKPISERKAIECHEILGKMGASRSSASLRDWFPSRAWSERPSSRQTSKEKTFSCISDTRYILSKTPLIVSKISPTVSETSPTVSKKPKTILIVFKTSPVSYTHLTLPTRSTV